MSDPFGLRSGTVALLAGVFVASLAGCGAPAPKEPGDAAHSQPEVQATQPAKSDAVAGTAVVLSTGHESYLQHCAACHGERGDGLGAAARFLFPKPRDFRAGRFRLLSTTNGMPTREDLNAVLLRGMPGSSMPSWAHLSQPDRDLLIDEIIQIRRQGLYDQRVAQLKEEDEDVVEDEVQALVKERTTPGPVVDLPQMPADEPSIARGKAIYLKQGCVSCHGNEGRGDGQQVMVDSEGLPTRPRDLTRGIFKGNPDPASVFRRIALGMPGTPMPSSPQLTGEQMAELAQFILSLSSESVREESVLKRNRIVAHRIAELPIDDQSDKWNSVEELRVGVTPLWWRDDADVDLRVQALHDGRSLAIRLSWRDTTADWHSTRSESFKDAAAVELYRGAREPFLGMGGLKNPVDVWFWDADRQSAEEAPDGDYPNMAVDVYPFAEPKGVNTAEYHRPGATMADQPPISLPAMAVGNQIVPAKTKEAGGSSLAGGGPGSVTFRPAFDQQVEAKGRWDDGRWTVVLRRPLDPKDGGAVKLEPGATVSAAFAIWDGAKGDRNGQKLVSIWQDFELDSGSR